MCICVKTQIDVAVYTHVPVTCTCIHGNMHPSICQEHDEEYQKFHVHNMSPHYTRLRVLSPLGEGLGIEIITPICVIKPHKNPKRRGTGRVNP